jgi:hypothetical protein
MSTAETPKIDRAKGCAAIRSTLADMAASHQAIDGLQGLIDEHWSAIYSNEERVRLILGRLGVEMPGRRFDADMAAAKLAELENALSSGGQTLGKIVTWQARSMRAARIEMLQNGPEKAMQWILNSIPDVDDSDPADQWDGKESAAEWLDRQQTADRAAANGSAS